MDTGVDAEEQQGEEDETEHSTESDDVDEFNQLDLTGGVDAITDEDLFVQTRDKDEWMVLVVQIIVSTTYPTT